VTAAVVSGAGAAMAGLFALGVPGIHVTGLIGFAVYAAVDSARSLRIMHRGSSCACIGPILAKRISFRGTTLPAGDFA